ncbi:MAG: hypothetical protein HY078_13430 [Elusimicrobia bacterium]|nr:hypothetical protein [Elusimicrobiota bacterium]
MTKKADRKLPHVVRDERKTAVEARRVRAEKTAAYDAKYQADALARREKLAAEASAKPA